MSVSVFMKSFTHRAALLVAACMYGVYAFSHHQWSNPWLIAACVLTFLIFPWFAQAMEATEDFIKLRTGWVFWGRVGRFVPQLALNAALLGLLLQGGLFDPATLDAIGGFWGAAVLTTSASQGLQYVAIALGGRQIGHRLYNVAGVLAANIVLSGLAALGFKEAQAAFVAVGLIFGFIGIVYSLITDLKAVFAPQGGVGVFFGTFNPAHVSHLKIVQDFQKKRNLDVVYIHPTTVPMMHAKMLREGLIRIEKLESGRRHYVKSERADPFLNYFPTGTEFYEVDNRFVMLKAAVKDQGLTDKIRVVLFKEKYDADGFYEVVKHIKKHHPRQRIHGLHGSDVGGMMMRNVYDESLIVWPCPVVRKDNVSATAIRSGAPGMTTPTVTRIMEFLEERKTVDGGVLEVHGETYTYRHPDLILVNQEEQA